MRGIECVWAGGALLGEGPVWDTARQSLWFVDIKQHKIHRFDPTDRSARSWAAPAQVGWILPREDGRLLTGLQDGLALFDPENGDFDLLPPLSEHPVGNRLNDATVAPDGIVWFGSMDDAETTSSGRVFRYDGTTAVPTEIAPVPITNGPAVSPDGRILYHVDTAGGVIHAVPISPHGELGKPAEFVRIAAAEGHPDGVTIDREGNVWVGIWGGWCARLYAPDGSLLHEVRLPVANVTKIALGGESLATAYVTTARIGLSDAASEAQPLAGGLFSFDVDVPGLPLPLVRPNPR